ncbi:peptidylprolyl isomerase [Paenibacillus hemerocallicola]|uniref:Peptidylprolyl isomerase n=1 Tax=Paenibacillus hemerocallicola TaxID=1172614 RepID=A0A5C4TFS8_9BACL|nr:peptidylprolyl isomerase [Paenibacillus hemerocallicola]TNJ67350.1 peptidylprolyl isomerase [Paenibacillus hemerocallicola]
MKSRKSSSTNKLWMGISIVLFVLLAGVSVFAFTKGGEPKDTVVATVNGVEIGKQQLFDELIRNGGAQVLNNLINEELVKQEADKAGVQVTDADLNKELDSFKKSLSLSSDEEFDMMLMQYGMTKDELKKQMPMQVRLRKLLEPKTDVTEEEMKKYYDENKEMLATPEQVKASHILVSTKEESEAILAQLNTGADFAQLAKEKSIDPGSKDNGGDLSYFAKGKMVKEFEDAAFTLPVGQISNVVQTEHGFHIIKVTDKKAAVTPTFEEKKNEIRETLVMQEVQELSNTWMQEVAGKANVTNTLQDV